MPLSPAILALLPTSRNGEVRRNFVVEIQTATPRRWTPFPGGLTVNSVAYTEVKDLEISNITKSLDGGSNVTCTLLIGNLDNLATDLVNNAANKRAIVIIRRVWFNTSWQQVDSDLFFQGRLARPYFSGTAVGLDCRMYEGRKGNSPNTKWSTVLTSHTPPAPNTKFSWITLR